MSNLQICNTFFEWEIAGQTPPSLEEALALNPICEQLQFLPLVYGKEEDLLLVREKPGEIPSKRLILPDEEAPIERIDSWGHSLLIQKWANKRNIPYTIPPWEVVKLVNSKTFSFAKSPLPGAKLILQGDPIPKSSILKSCYGTAGRGLIFSESPKALAFCQKQWEQNLPVIAEPFVERDLDFSTQWVITKSGEIAFLGVTTCQTSKKGSHISNTVGGPPPAFLDKQKEIAMDILEEIATMGYFGEIGFDAMIYNGDQLQPVVEINARKTMGYATLMLQKNHHPHRIVTLSYTTSQEGGPLPKKLKERSFSRQVLISIQ